MIFGYARISTTKDSQTTQRQLLTLDQYAKSNNFIFDEIIEERVSVTINAENRQEYSKLKSKLRQDHILVLTNLDRLVRNADNVIMELKDLKYRCIRIISLDMPYMCYWDKTNDNSIYDMVIDIVMTIKAHITQQEREKIVSRINQVLEITRTTGKTLGRPKAELPKNFIREYTKFKDGHYGNMTSSGLAKMLGIGRSTLYKYIKLYDNISY